MKLLPILFLAGCALEEPTFSDVEQFVKKNPGDCPSYGCGTNSSIVDGRYLTELHELGEESPENMRLVSFGMQIGPFWTVLRPDVMDGALVGRDPNTNDILVPVERIAGAKFTVEHVPSGDLFYVTVVTASQTEMWAQAPLKNRRTWQYELRYRSTTEPDPRMERSVCSQPFALTWTNGSTWMAPQMSLLFDDDRIDSDALAVSAEKPNWFTIACAGSALAKLHLTANTKAGSAVVGRTTTLDDRTAALKGITADYCGMGHSYTVPGQKLHYRDNSGHMSDVLKGEEIEGLWTKDGLMCGGRPRVEFEATELSLKTFGPSLDDEFADFGCARPQPCKPAVFVGADHRFDGAYFMTTNYH